MQQMMVSCLLWLSIVGSALIGGLYFAFSTFIMTALARLDQAAGIAAMNAINTDIQRSLFMPIFLGSTLAGTALAVLALFRWSEPAALSMLAGGVLYLVGMFIVTMVRNVPLNNALLAAASNMDAASTWARYLKEWTFWNHLRTIASVVALILFTISLQRMRPV